MGTRLYVGNLPFEVCEADLRELFEGVGQVADCNLIVDKFTNKSRGFAFVEMSSDDEAQKAIATLNNTEVEGRSISVAEARPQAPREDRGDRGGGRYHSGGGGGYRR